MFARSAKLAVLLLSTAFISCSQQDDILTEGATDGTEITTTVSVNVPDVFKSRTVPDEVYQYGTDTDKVYKYIGESGMPSIGNLDLKEHPLSFTVGIYVAKTVDGETTYTLVDQQEQKNVSDDKADFNFHLIKGLPYYIVAYADFNNDENTHLQLDKIPVTNELNPELNNELKDAFFANQTFTADDKINVVLKRPFGKLRLLAHDFNTFAAGGVNKITNVEVIYNKPPMLGSTLFNAITGKFDSEAKADGDVSRNASPVSYALEYNEDGTADYTAVFTTYLPVNLGTSPDPIDYNPVEEGTPVPQSWMFPFDVIVTYTDANGNTRTRKRNFQFEIPVKRNWLTTVDIDNFWTDNSQITVSIDHRFEGFIDYPTTSDEILIDNYPDLRKAIADCHTSSSKEVKIKLINDIKANYTDGLELGCYFTQYVDNDGKTKRKYTYVDGVKVYLNLNGHKIYTPEVSHKDSNTGEIVDDTWKLFSNSNKSLFSIYGACTLIIDDTSKNATGTIEDFYAKGPIIAQWRCAGNIIINAGKIICKGEREAIYLGDTPTYLDQGIPPSTLTINGGWFEGERNDCLINLNNGSQAGAPKHENDQGYGVVHINGGSFVNFNPANGDNISGTMTNEWVDPTKFTVLTETVDNKTVYTVVPKDTPHEY